MQDFFDAFCIFRISPDWSRFEHLKVDGYWFCKDLYRWGESGCCGTIFTKRDFRRISLMLFVVFGFLPIGADLSIQKVMAIIFAMISIDGMHLAAVGRFSRNVIFAGIL